MYHHYTKDASSAFTLASYIVTRLALFLALIAAGYYIGLHKPKSDDEYEYDSTYGELEYVKGETFMKQLDTRLKEKIMASLKVKEEINAREKVENWDRGQGKRVF